MRDIIDFFTGILPAFESFGVWGYWFILLIAIADTLIVAGIFMPGTVFIIFAGVLVSRGTYDLGDMALFASAGSIIGGVLSYYLGTRGTRLFKKENRFLREEGLEKGKDFLKRYGNASILLGRFLGPASSTAAFVAGLTHMNVRVFLLWHVFASLVWGVGYIFIGNFLGGSLLLEHQGTLIWAFVLVGVVIVGFPFFYRLFRRVVQVSS